MKRILCLLLTAAIFTAAFASISVSAQETEQDRILTVTDEGRVLAQVEVGNEFIFRVGINMGDYSIINGQGYVTYDADYVQLVEYGKTDSRGNVNMDYYTFPEKIRNTSLMCNYFGQDNEINYNFSKGNTGIDVFDDVTKPYFRVRFKAVAPGTTEISHTMYTMTTIVDGLRLRLYNRGKPNEQLDPIPYTLSSAEPATALIGDADGDYAVTVMDATFIQRLTAGADAAYQAANTDVNNDGEVNLKDALQIMRYLAELSTDTDIGVWVFESEIGEELF